MSGCESSQERALVEAAADNNVDKVRELIHKGTNPNASAMDDWTPLTIAARKGNSSATKVLLDAGADPMKAEGGGLAPLYWAAMYGREEIVRILLKHGARDVSDLRRSALAVAQRERETTIAALLLTASK